MLLGSSIESYSTVGGFTDTVSGLNWFGQTFRVGASGLYANFYIYNFNIYLNSGNGFMHVFLKKVDPATGFPSGAILASGIFADTPTEGWYETSIGPAWYELKSSGTYAIILGSPTGKHGFRHGTPGNYNGGIMIHSTNGGSTWINGNSASFPADISFEIYGGQRTPVEKGYLSYQTNGSLYKLPICTSDEATSYNNEQTLRVAHNNNIYCADLVNISGANASSLRVQTPNGLKSWREFQK